MAKTGTGSQHAPKPHVHFIGVMQPAIAFDERYDYMVRFFGKPDFVHRFWDIRAQQEIAPGDVAIFAKGTDADPPTPYSFDDSSFL